MKITYYNKQIPQKVRIPFSELEEGEICWDIRPQDDIHNQSSWFKEHWRIEGIFFNPVNHLNKNKTWSGYPVEAFTGRHALYKDSTVEVLR
jgi:hypothetical protein